MFNLIKRCLAFIKGGCASVPNIPTIIDYHEHYLKKEKLSYGGKQVFINNITLDDVTCENYLIFNMKLSNGTIILIKEK